MRAGPSVIMVSIVFAEATWREPRMSYAASMVEPRMLYASMVEAKEPLERPSVDDVELVEPLERPSVDDVERGGGMAAAGGCKGSLRMKSAAGGCE